MKNSLRRLVVYLILVMWLLNGCQGQTVEESNVQKQKIEVTTVRWAVMGNSGKTLVANRKAEQINQMLSERGCPIQLELIYIGDSQIGNQLALLQQQEKKFDIITFWKTSCGGAEEMKEYLLPLELYMTEGKPLYEVYQLFSEALWQSDQIDGHTYNLGRLLSIVSPTYYVRTKDQMEQPTYPEEAFTAGDEEAIWEIVHEENIMEILPEPYIGNAGDGFYISHTFHMIAPGVGFSMDAGEVFENVWESKYIKEREEKELTWLETQRYISIMDSRLFEETVYVTRSISTQYKPVIRKYFNGEVDDGAADYEFIYPASGQMRLAPTLRSQYTSILKNSEHIEESLKLLAILNTDQEICEAFCAESKETAQETIPVFTALCNAPGNEGEKRTAQEQNECFAALEENQKSPILGFTFDRRPVEEEVRRLEELERTRHMELVIEVTQRLEAVIDDEEQLKLATKEIWLEKMADYKRKLKEAGIDRVIEEANRQLAAWQDSR